VNGVLPEYRLYQPIHLGSNFVFHWCTRDHPDNPDVGTDEINLMMTSFYGTIGILAAAFQWQQVPAVVLSYFYIFFGLYK
jgi:hypothetical protein